MNDNHTEREDRFWEIAASESFRAAFVDRHPLLRINVELNGETFYDVANLRKILLEKRERLLRVAMVKDKKQLRDGIETTLDWIEQSQWINAKLDSEGY